MLSKGYTDASHDAILTDLGVHGRTDRLRVSPCWGSSPPRSHPRLQPV